MPLTPASVSLEAPSCLAWYTPGPTVPPLLQSPRPYRQHHPADTDRIRRRADMSGRYTARVPALSLDNCHGRTDGHGVRGGAGGESHAVADTTVVTDGMGGGGHEVVSYGAAGLVHGRFVRVGASGRGRVLT